MAEADLNELVEALLDVDAPGAAAAAVSASECPACAVAVAYRQLRRDVAAGSIDGPTMGAATSLCLRLLAGVPVAPLDAGATAAVVCCAAGDRVEAEAAAVVLGQGGWAVDVVGGARPVTEVTEYLEARGAAALVVAGSNPRNLPELALAVRAGHRGGIPVVATGGAFGRDDLRALRLGVDAWVADLQDLPAVVAEWTAGPHEVMAPPEASPEVDVLRQSRFAVLAALADMTSPWGSAGASGQPEEADDRRVVEDLFDYLQAAVLVDDGRVLIDCLNPRTAKAAAHLLDGLAAVLPAEAPRARAFVEDGRRHVRLVGGRPTRAAVPPVLAEIPGRADQGQVFTDLLLLAAAGTQAPLALVSVRQGNDQWSTLTFGAERSDCLNDRKLLDFVASQGQPVEVPDLGHHELLASSSVTRAPALARWLYGTSLVGSDGSLLGVFCVLDRHRRQASRREQRTVAAVARQLADQLGRWRRGPAPVAKAHAGGPTSLAGHRPGAPEGQHLLRSQEVAVLFDVTERTVINWAASGKLPALRTIGGHLRFRRDDVMALLGGRRQAQAVGG